MACHTSAKRKALYATLHDIDPNLPAPADFWHNKGRQNDGSIMVSQEAAETALDSVFAAAISNGTAESPDDWSALDGDERLDLHIAWMRARNELLDEGLTSSQIAALSRYVTHKSQMADRERDAEINHAVREETRGLKTRTKAAIAGLGLLTLVSMAAAGMGLSTASTTDNTGTATTMSTPMEMPADDASVSGYSDLQGTVRGLDAAAAFKVGNKKVFTKTVKGKCAPGQVKAKVNKTKKVNWLWKDGNIGKKKVKKGKKVCVFTTTGADGAKTTDAAVTNAAGQITKLPANFPKNPTAKDIAALGLTKDTPVAPSLRLPQPSGEPNSPAELANKVRPVSAGPVRSITNELDGWTSQVVDVTWRIEGGNGVLRYTDQNMQTQYVELSPNKSVVVTQSVPLGNGGSGSTAAAENYFFRGAVLSDYGQASVPPSTVSNWDVPQAMDASGIGSPVGKAANSAFYQQDSGPRDGYVMLTYGDGQMVGDYNY